MKRFWISWYQPTEDYRPLTDPPNAAILGWWCSGYGESAEIRKLWGLTPRQTSATLCALVNADSRESAENAVHIDWPEATEWRFCYERECDFLPGDRFPLSDWVRDRLK